VDTGISVGGGMVAVGVASATIGAYRGLQLARVTSTLHTPRALGLLVELSSQMPEPLQSTSGMLRLLDPRATLSAVNYGTRAAATVALAGEAVQSDATRLLALRRPAGVSTALVVGGAMLACVGAGVLLSSVFDD
jgi:hypothetical protein